LESAAEERRRGLGGSGSRRYPLEMNWNWSRMEKASWKVEGVGIADWFRGGGTAELENEIRSSVFV
jgi:hypothetical protein